MKYILISKESEEETEISKREALNLLKNNYQEPKYVLEHAERLFGNRIVLTFNWLEVR